MSDQEHESRDTDIPNLEHAPSEKEDIHTRKSNKTGLAGVFETFIRRFRTLSFILLLTPVALIFIFAFGFSCLPGVYLFQWIHGATAHWPQFFHYLMLAMSLALGFYLYGLTLIFIVPLINKLVVPRIKAWRGTWHSNNAIPWYIHNALTQLVRYTFLDHITPTPLNVLFFRMMGMKIGKGVIINTSNISDPCLITLEDYVTIGGSATLFAHYGQKGYLIISPVTIKKGTTIGLKASVMGGCTIGKHVLIKPHTCVLPKTVIEDNTTYSG